MVEPPIWVLLERLGLRIPDQMGIDGRWIVSLTLPTMFIAAVVSVSIAYVKARDAAVSGRVAAEVERQKALRDVESARADRMNAIGQLAAGVAHDINNPLAYVVGNLTYIHELLTEHEQECARDPELHQALVESLQGALRAQRIVGDLRAYARVDPERIEPTDVRRALSSSLQLVFARDNDISELSPLAQLPALTSLSLGKNPIAELSPLASVATLEWLDVDEIDATALDPLAGLLALEHVSAERGVISSVHFGAQPQLRELFLTDNLIADISGLAGLTGLEVLFLEKNQVQDLTPLAGMQALERLRVSDNDIVDLSPLAGATALTELWIRNNKIKDLAPLAGHPLEIVLANDNEITSIAPVATFVPLWEINLSNNQISDLKPIADPAWAELQCLHLDLRGNPLNAEAIDEIIPSLCAKGVFISWGDNEDCNVQCLPQP